MKNKTKRVLWGFFSLDYKAMEEYLEKMAEKGWMLVKIGKYIAKFRAIEPQKLKFYVDVFKKGGTLTPDNNEEIVEYRKLCQESGWTYITSQEYLQFFYADRENDPVPIQTDKEIEQRIVENTLLKRELSGFLIILITCIFVLIMSLPIKYTHLLSFVGVSATFLFPILFIITTISAVYSIIWMVTARRKIKNGLSVTKPTLKSARRRIIIFNGSTWIILLTFVFAFIADAKFKSHIILLSVLGSIIGSLIGSAFRYLVKKNKMKKDNIVFNLVITLIISVIFISIVGSFITESSEDIYKINSIPDNYPIISLEEITKDLVRGGVNREFIPGMSPIVPKHFTYREYENRYTNTNSLYTKYYEAMNPYFADIIFNGIIEEFKKGMKWRGMTIGRRNMITDDEMKNLWGMDNMALTEEGDIIILQKGNIVLQFGYVSGNMDFNDKYIRELIISRFFSDSSMEN